LRLVWRRRDHRLGYRQHRRGKSRTNLRDGRIPGRRTHCQHEPTDIVKSHLEGATNRRPIQPLHAVSRAFRLLGSGIHIQLEYIAVRRDFPAHVAD
jgi:hypothetical protein